MFCHATNLKQGDVKNRLLDFFQTFGMLELLEPPARTTVICRFFYARNRIEYTYMARELGMIFIITGISLSLSKKRILSNEYTDLEKPFHLMTQMDKTSVESHKVVPICFRQSLIKSYPA